MKQRKPARWFLILLFIAAVVGAVICWIVWRHPLPPLSAVSTLAGSDKNPDVLRFVDPFGIAINADGVVYLTDGATGRLWQIIRDKRTGAEAAKIIAENLDTPSAIALAPDGTLIVAETGAHVIRRIDPQSGRVSLIAGVPGRAGYLDGSGAEALFDGPIGVAVGSDGLIFVADTYNDRIRTIGPDGLVHTLAGGEPGFIDAAGAEARFDTPCGVAVAADGSAIVADTGNQRLRRVGLDGAVTTIAGTGETGGLDGPALGASFNEPIGVAVGPDGTIYVTDAGGPGLRVYKAGEAPAVTTLAGGSGRGLADGPAASARFNYLCGVAIAPDGSILLADAGNGLVRAVIGEGRERGVMLATETAQALRLTAASTRAMGEPRWPYDPPTRVREIAATFGEIRGALVEGKDAWFHNGLDIPGGYGETVRAIRPERVLRPLAVEGVDTARERISFPMIGYIHLRVGRDSADRPLDAERFRLRRDSDGRVTGVRVRRGARFAAGDPIGTLNNQYHVHLVVGPGGAGLNALAALDLPGVRDTIAPTIEPDGVRLVDRQGEEFRPAPSVKPGPAAKSAAPAKSDGQRGANPGPIEVHGDVRIIVRAYDQMDGNAARRRLGPYRLGYQILNADGTAAPGFAAPLMNISFESLPDDPRAVRLAYAEGSQAGYGGETIFDYIVTNRVRDSTAAEDYWHASALPAGDYTLRVLVEDFFGNRATRDVPVRVTDSPAGR
jgi:sugar lactone lactonase YvrE